MKVKVINGELTSTGGYRPSIDNLIGKAFDVVREVDDGYDVMVDGQELFLGYEEVEELYEKEIAEEFISQDFVNSLLLELMEICDYREKCEEEFFPTICRNKIESILIKTGNYNGLIWVPKIKLTRELFEDKKDDEIGTHLLIIRTAYWEETREKVINYIFKFRLVIKGESMEFLDYVKIHPKDSDDLELHGKLKLTPIELYI